MGRGSCHAGARAVSGTFGPHDELPTDRGVIITCVGKKRSGKTIMSTLWFQSYDGDKIVIDVAGDDGPAGPDVIDLTGTVNELPRKWPEHLRPDDGTGAVRPMTLRYVPDPGSPTYGEDMDAVVGLAMSHGNCALMVHEMGVLAPSNRVRRHTARFLRFNRHRKVTGIFAAPRPVTMDPLVIGQSDLIYVFDLPVPADQQRVASTVGWNPQEFSELVEDLGRHEYLRYDANEDKPQTEDDPDLRLVHFPALPEDVVKQVKRYAAGGAQIRSS